MAQLQISVEDLQKRSVFIGVPMYGGRCDFPFVKGLNELTTVLSHYKIPYKFFILSNESLIPRARNYIADEFMRSGMTHLLFIDSDVGFSPDDAIALLAYADPQSDKDIVTGPYPKKTISWEKIKAAVDKGFADDNPNNLEHLVGDFVVNFVPGVSDVTLNEAIEVYEAGTGFMMIQRHAFETIADKYHDYLYYPDHARTEHFDGLRKIMCYFHCDIDYGVTDKELWDLVRKAKNGEDVSDDAQRIFAAREKSNLRYLSEDYWFCRRARDSGLKVWMLPWLRLQHMGSYLFSGSLAAMAEVGASPTVDINQVRQIRQKGKKKKK